MTEIADVVAERGISEILHFSTNHGLTGILAAKGILSRQQLPESKYLEHVYKPNAEVRHDGPWLDYVNLSIGRLNTEYFEHSNRWHQNEDVWWCALSFDPIILEEDGVLFATTNNMYSGCCRKGGVDGLEALFARRITCWPGQAVDRPANIPAGWTTDRQAEVLYPTKLDTRYLRRIYVATGPHHDIAASNRDILLQKWSKKRKVPVPVVIAPEIFNA